jgi:hypothetical protein
VEEVEEPAWHGFSDVCIEVVGVKEEVDSIWLFIMILSGEEEDTTVGVTLDPLGIDVISISNRDLGCNSPIVVLKTNGLQGKPKLPISLLWVSFESFAEVPVDDGELIISLSEAFGL